MSDWLMAGAQGAGSIISAIGGWQTAHEANAISQQNLEFQQDAFAQNLASQKEQQQYARNLQERLFSREDTSIQRRANDLRAAGLSPVLAAGQGARAGAVVPSQAPQKQAAQKSLVGKQLQLAAMGEAANISKTIAETRLIAAQADEKSTQATEAASMLAAKIERGDGSLARYARMINGMDVDLRSAQLQEQQAKTMLSQLDREWKVALRDYVDKTGTENPAIVEYKMALLYKRIREVDAEWAERMKTMAGASTIGRIAIPLIRGLLGGNF